MDMDIGKKFHCENCGIISISKTIHSIDEGQPGQVFSEFYICDCDCHFMIDQEGKCMEYGLHILGYPCKCFKCEKKFQSRIKLRKHLELNPNHYIKV